MKQKFQIDQKVKVTRNNGDDTAAPTIGAEGEIAEIVKIGDVIYYGLSGELPELENFYFVETELEELEKVDEGNK